MIQPQLVLSSSLSGTFTALSLPGPVNLTGSIEGPGGKLQYQVDSQRSYSFQAFVTGSVNGTLVLQASNNMAGWVYVSSSVVSGNVSQDVMFVETYNPFAFARLLWSGSAGSGSYITIAKAAVP